MADVIRTILRDLKDDRRENLNEYDQQAISRRLQRYAEEERQHRPPPPRPSAFSSMPEPMPAHNSRALHEEGEVAPPPTADGGSAAVPDVDWRTALEALLMAYFNAKDISPRSVNSCQCPFTRAGLADLYRVDQRACSGRYYASLRREFNLPLDPTSPHTQQGGCAHCSGKVKDAFTAATLEQHCGKKTEAIVAIAPDDRDDCDEASRLHYVLLLVLKYGNASAYDSAAPVSKRPRMPEKELKETIAWPPMLHVRNLAPLTDPAGVDGEAVAMMSKEERANRLSPNSSARLQEYFARFVPSLCVPIFYQKTPRCEQPMCCTATHSCGSQSATAPSYQHECQEVTRPQSPPCPSGVALALSPRSWL